MIESKSVNVRGGKNNNVNEIWYVYKNVWKEVEVKSKEKSKYTRAAANKIWGWLTLIMSGRQNDSGT